MFNFEQNWATPYDFEYFDTQFTFPNSQNLKKRRINQTRCRCGAGTVPKIEKCGAVPAPCLIYSTFLNFGCSSLFIYLLFIYKAYKAIRLSLRLYFYFNFRQEFLNNIDILNFLETIIIIELRQSLEALFYPSFLIFKKFTKKLV